MESPIPPAPACNLGILFFLECELTYSAFGSKIFLFYVLGTNESAQSGPEWHLQGIKTVQQDIQIETDEAMAN